MARRPSVPQFGKWENPNQNVGYTMYFENVRNDKSAGPKKFINPNDPQEMQHAYNMGGSANGTPQHPAAPKPSQPRSIPEHHQNYQNQRPNQIYQNQRPNQNYQNQRPNQNYLTELPNHDPSPVRSRPSPGPNKRPGAVPKFGEWEDINSTPAGGYTMQFENLKKKKDAAKASPMQIPVQSVQPERNTYHNGSFFSRLLGCFSPYSRK